VIFIVHGGGGSRGDKASRAVIENKVARWVPAGFIELLGREPNYTSKVELFLVTLDPSVAKLLPHVSKGQKPGGAELPL
jgi:hypothetical protein